MFVIQPRIVSELDRDRVSLHSLCAFFDMGVSFIAADQPRGKLKKNRTKFADLP
jgi:hypothetical protein